MPATLDEEMTVAADDRARILAMISREADLDGHNLKHRCEVTLKCIKAEYFPAVLKIEGVGKWVLDRSTSRIHSFGEVVWDVTYSFTPCR